MDEVNGGRHRLVLGGELDLVGAPLLGKCVSELESDVTTRLEIDLSELTFIDSTGVRALMAAKDLASRSGYEFAVIPGPPRVQRIFEVTGLLEALPFEPAEGEQGAGGDASTAPETTP